MNKQQIAKMAESNQYSKSPLTSKSQKKKKKKKEKKMTPVSRICVKARVEQFMQKKIIYYFANSVNKNVFSTKIEDNYNFVEV